MIGIFDSGIGGLTVVKKVLEVLPEYQILYFGDTARTPYGGRGEEVIKRYALEDAEILIRYGAKIIIVACNTVSAVAIDFLKEKLKVPIFEVVSPAVEKAVRITRNKKIGVIGTRATIHSKIYEKLIKEKNPQIQVFQNPAPLLVSLVEEGWFKKPETKMIVKRYLYPLKFKQIDTLILACTHYPFLREIIQRKVGRRVKLIDPAEEVVLKVKEFLEQNPEIEQSLNKNNQHRFLVSDLTIRSQGLAKNWLGEKIKLEKIKEDVTEAAS
ncbi:MAG: glutamate racemase [Patescibacteria group bacterium]